MTSLPQSMSAIASSTFGAVATISLRQALLIADSHDFAAVIAHRNYVAAVDETSLQQTLSAIAGCDFTAADMMSLRQSRSVADSNYFAAAARLQQLRRCSRYDFSAAIAVSHCWLQLGRSSYDFSAALTVHRGQQLLCGSRRLQQLRRCTRSDFSVAPAVSHCWLQLRPQ